MAPNVAADADVNDCRPEEHLDGCAWLTVIAGEADRADCDAEAEREDGPDPGAQPSCETARRS